MFETEKDILDWYEQQPRALSEEFVNSLEWDTIRDYPINPEFVPVLFYMRDVESYTEVYYNELLPTPTGKNPFFRKFMDRWSVEEYQHARVLNRFLNEAGIETSKNWWNEAKAAIPRMYTVESRLATRLARIVGRHFSGVHMVWGAINEMTTLQGYHRLGKIAGHPVLARLLHAIGQEESIHANFYWQIARLHLEASGLTQRLSRFMIEKFWTPVGQGPKPQADTDYVISILFEGAAGVEIFENTVSHRTKRLPGLSDLRVLTDRVAAISIDGRSKRRLVTI